MKKFLTIVDSISNWSGMIARWAVLALVLVLSFEVMMRHVLNSPTIWAHEMSTMLGVFLVCIGWSYVHLRHGHVRVDVFYSRMSPRGKAITDIVNALVFFFPLLLVLIYGASRMAWEAYIFDEVLMASFWYPPALPIRLVVVIGLCTFFLQGTAEFARDVHLVAKGGAR
ncbi:MAG: TRAP transporter small permease subunit [Chloroflexi bacterium]|nr:TRAP transporter small permease subunit [Chloroflexota bacterium]